MTRSPAFHAGLLAWQRGDSIFTTNPYPANSDEHYEFNEGLATAAEADELDRLPASAATDENDVHL